MVMMTTSLVDDTVDSFVMISSTPSPDPPSTCDTDGTSPHLMPVKATEDEMKRAVVNKIKELYVFNGLELLQSYLYSIIFIGCGKGECQDGSCEFCKETADLREVGYSQYNSPLVMIPTSIFTKYIPTPRVTSFFMVLTVYFGIIHYMNLLFDKKSRYQRDDVLWTKDAEAYREMALLLWKDHETLFIKAQDHAQATRTHLSMLHAYEMRICYGQAIMTILNDRKEFSECDFDVIKRDVETEYKKVYAAKQTLSILPVKEQMSRDDGYDALKKMVDEEQRNHQRLIRDVQLRKIEERQLQKKKSKKKKAHA
jgi:hypothetical protein